MYSPPDWDSRCDQAVTEPNPSKRQALVYDCVKTIYDEAMSVPIMTDPVVFAMDKSVRGYNFCDVSAHLWTPAGLWLSK